MTWLVIIRLLRRLAERNVGEPADKDGWMVSRGAQSELDTALTP
jgi:hypothetical protein